MVLISQFGWDTDPDGLAVCILHTTAGIQYSMIEQTVTKVCATVWCCHVKVTSFTIENSPNSGISISNDTRRKWHPRHFSILVDKLKVCSINSVLEHFGNFSIARAYKVNFRSVDLFRCFGNHIPSLHLVIPTETVPHAT